MLLARTAERIRRMRLADKPETAGSSRLASRREPGRPSRARSWRDQGFRDGMEVAEEERGGGEEREKREINKQIKIRESWRGVREKRRGEKSGLDC